VAVGEVSAGVAEGENVEAKGAVGETVDLRIVA
jgi:hypothetical protein